MASMLMGIFKDTRIVILRVLCTNTFSILKYIREKMHYAITKRNINHLKSKHRLVSLIFKETLELARKIKLSLLITALTMAPTSIPHLFTIRYIYFRSKTLVC
jgi:hypothetical protein